MKNSKKILCIALVFILVGSIFASLLQSNFGKVNIKDIYLVTEDQQYLHAQAFIPKEASEDNKLPCVITCHGWLNCLEMQDAACIELSRRGCVVISMDAYGHGLSSSFVEGISPDSADNGQGMRYLVEYVTSNAVNFIDTSRVGLMGHSMGGVCACDTLMYYTNARVQALEDAAQPDSDGGVEITDAELAYAESFNKIAAILPTGITPVFISEEGYQKVDCNIGFLYGLIEEGGAEQANGNARLEGTSVEALTLVNSVDPSVTYAEVNKYYGNAADRTLRVLFQPYITHPLITISPKCTQMVVQFFTDTLNLKTNLSVGNQLFFIKELFNLLIFVGLFMLLVPLADLLMKIPCFAALRGAEGPKLPALDDGKKRRKFWIGWAVCGIVSFLCAWLTIILWTTPAFNSFSGYGMSNHALFASPAFNYIGTWTLFMAIFGFAWFFINYKKDKEAGIRNDEMIGWKISGKEFWKSVGLTAAIMALLYAVVWLIKWAFNVDGRFWTPAFKTFNLQHVFYFFNYLPIFFAFYLSNSLTVNGACRFEGANEKKEMFILGLGNIIGCGLVWLIQYGKLVTTGTILWVDRWTAVLVICFCVWQLFLAPFLLRKFYKLTGKNWLGALVVSSVYVMMGIANTAIHSSIF